MRIYLTVSIMLVSISLQYGAAAQSSDDPLRHGHALIIGNSNYTSWPPLGDVSYQVDELVRGLGPHFDSVEPAKDLDIKSLRERIRKFLLSYGKNSNARLFIYYAGHGYTETILSRNTRKGYITAVDTPFTDGIRGTDAAREKAMSMDEIGFDMTESLAKHVLFVFDACFAGTIFTTRGPNESPPMWTQAQVDRLMRNPARDIITAGKDDELVPAHSPMPDLLLAAVNGKADRYGHGVISAADIHAYLTDKTLHMHLTPQEGRLWGSAFAEGEFLFRVSALPPAPPPEPPIPAPSTRESIPTPTNPVQMQQIENTIRTTNDPEVAWKLGHEYPQFEAIGRERAEWLKTKRDAVPHPVGASAGN